MTRPTKRAAALLAAGALLSGVASYAVFAPTAEAIPGAQEKCAFGLKEITPASGWQPLGLAVTVNNGTSARKVSLAGNNVLRNGVTTPRSGLFPKCCVR